MKILRFKDADYQELWDFQEQLAQKMQADEEVEDHLLLIEHRPVYTIGRDGTDADLLVPSKVLKEEGINVYHTNRGGKITYHGPGQLVGYPIINLKRHGRDLLIYIRKLEESLIELLEEYQISTHRIEGLPGIWIGNNKIAAIGIGVKRWITRHGFALNVNTDLRPFFRINPCGLVDKGVTSMRKNLKHCIDIEEVSIKYIDIFTKIFAVESEGSEILRI